MTLVHLGYEDPPDLTAAELARARAGLAVGGLREWTTVTVGLADGSVLDVPALRVADLRGPELRVALLTEWRGHLTHPEAAPEYPADVLVLGTPDARPEVPLADIKAQAMAAIDAETEEAIARSGFTWRGKVFSLSPTAQVKWARLDAKKDTWRYPFPVNTIDDSEAVIIESAADVTEATDAADATMFRMVQASALAKASVRNATDEAGVEIALLSVGPELGKAAIAPATRSWTDWLFWWRS